jgi:hypothetical protein
LALNESRRHRTVVSESIEIRVEGTGATDGAAVSDDFGRYEKVQTFLILPVSVQLWIFLSLSKAKGKEKFVAKGIVSNSSHLDPKLASGGGPSVIPK